MSDKTKYLIAWIVVLLVLLIPIVCGLFAIRGRDSTPAMERDTVTIVVRDTVTIVKPQPIVVSSAGLQRVTLPLWQGRDSADLSAGLQVDSVTVALPIERRVYADSSYRAVVSGAFVQLDSISVYPRREVQRITIRERPRRWGLSVGVGYGITPRGWQPYVGVSVGWRVVSW